MPCTELLTVTAEKETKHRAANRKKNIPPSVGFSDSSSSWIYLQESTVLSKTYVRKVTKFISIHCVHVHHYSLVVSYTGMELFQHRLRGRTIFRILHYVPSSITNQRDILPELLELAAGYIHQGGV